MVDKSIIKEDLEKALNNSRERNFVQSVDLSIGLKNIDLQSEKVEEVVLLPHGRGSSVKICALVDKAMQTNAEKVFDKIILKSEFSKWMKDVKKMKKLAEECDFFVAQASVMGDVAKTFGRVLGPRGKMPNPKASCVVPPGADLELLKKRLKKTVILRSKKSPVINVKVGKENQEKSEVVDNIHRIMESLYAHLPNGRQNIKHVYIKTTMGPSVKIM